MHGIDFSHDISVFHNVSKYTIDIILKTFRERTFNEINEHLMNLMNI